MCWFEERKYRLHFLLREVHEQMENMKEIRSVAKEMRSSARMEVCIEATTFESLGLVLSIGSFNSFEEEAMNFPWFSRFLWRTKVWRELATLNMYFILVDLGMLIGLDTQPFQTMRDYMEKGMTRNNIQR